MEKKSIFLSKTFWGAVLVLISQICDIIGVKVSVVGLENDIVAILGAIMAIYGRIKARKEISL